MPYQKKFSFYYYQNIVNRALNRMNWIVSLYLITTMNSFKDIQPPLAVKRYGVHATNFNITKLHEQIVNSDTST